MDEGCGWVDVVLGLDWYPRKIIGDNASRHHLALA
jgi:hypothetical protein